MHTTGRTNNLAPAFSPNYTMLLKRAHPPLVARELPLTLQLLKITARVAPE